MRTSLAILFGCAVLAALAAPAAASDEDPGPKVRALGALLQSPATSEETWKAYAEARKALDASAKGHTPEEVAAHPAQQAFDALTRQAAGALEPAAAEALQALETISADDQAAWKDKWEAYKAAKEALEEAAGDRPKVADKKGPASDYYALIQEQVANAVRRENLSAAGWLMGFFGALLLWGGFTYCVGVARKATKAQQAA